MFLLRPFVTADRKLLDNSFFEMNNPRVPTSLFSILPKDAGGSRNQFVCCKPEDCTNIIWSSGKEHRFGLGPYLIADNKFFILNDDGTLTIAKASINSFEFLDNHRIIEGHDAWGPIAIADGFLLMRDSKKMVCLDVRR